MAGEAIGVVTGETVGVIIIAIFQAFQTVVMLMGTYILKDLRDRVARLEDIEMKAAKFERDRPLGA